MKDSSYPSGRGIAVGIGYPEKRFGMNPRPIFMSGERGSPSTSSDVTASQIMQNTFEKEDAMDFKLSDEEVAEALKYFDAKQQNKVSSLLESQILYESTAKRFLVNLVQFAAGAGLDIAGMGLGQDTAVDLIVALAETNEVLGQNEFLKNVESVTLQGFDIVDQLQGINLQQGANHTYQSVKKVLINIMGALKKAGVDPESELKKFADKIREIVANAAQAVGDWIAALVPDLPGIDIVIAGGLKVGAENAYPTMADAYDNKLPAEIKAILADPKKMEAVLNKLINSLIVGLTKAKSIENLPGFLGQIGSAGIEKALSFLQSTVKPQIPSMVQMANKVIPFFFAATALIQIIYNKDYEQQTTNDATAAVESAIRTIKVSQSIIESSDIIDDEEEVVEMSAAGSGAVQGYSGPLTDENLTDKI